MGWWEEEGCEKEGGKETVKNIKDDYCTSSTCLNRNMVITLGSRMNW